MIRHDHLRVRANLVRVGLIGLVENVCARRKVHVDEVLGGCRHAAVVAARREVVNTIRDTYGYSYPQLGRMFQRNHTTIRTECEVRQRELSAEYATGERGAA